MMAIEEDQRVVALMSLIEESEKNAFNDKDDMEGVSIGCSQMNIGMMGNGEKEGITVDEILSAITKLAASIEKIRRERIENIEMIGEHGVRRIFFRLADR